MHLLHRVGCEDDELVVAVATALAGLEIVALRGLDRTQTRAAALAVDHQARKLGTGQVAQPLGHERDAGARRRGHHPLTGRGTAVDHIDRRDLRFGLEHHHARAFPRLELHEGLHHLRLRSDRVAEITVATVANRRVGDHLVAFHQFYLFLHSLFEFLTINRDTTVGTDHRARSAARARLGIRHPGRRIALAVDLRGEGQHIARTRGHAHAATLATLLVDNDRSFDFCHNAMYC